MEVFGHLIFNHFGMSSSQFNQLVCALHDMTCPTILSLTWSEKRIPQNLRADHDSLKLAIDLPHFKPTLYACRFHPHLPSSSRRSGLLRLAMANFDGISNSFLLGFF